MENIDIDLVKLNLNDNSMLVLKIIISIIMFGVALNLKVSDFKNLLKKPKGLILGLTSYYFLLPALTILFVIAFKMKPSIAMGLALIAASPGGNLGNVYTSLSKGNSALSIGITSLTTILSVIATPFYMIFLGKYIPGAENLMAEIKMDPQEAFVGVFLMLGLPIIIGMSFSKYFPLWSDKIKKYIAPFSLIILIVFVIGALVANFQHFLNHYQLIITISVLHNLMFFGTGYLISRIFKTSTEDRNAFILSFGVRNTALSLALVFQFFQGLGGMAMIVAFWGITQNILGILFSFLLKKVTIESAKKQEI